MNKGLGRTIKLFPFWWFWKNANIDKFNLTTNTQK
jgi:hypothetical protein